METNEKDTNNIPNHNDTQTAKQTHAQNNNQQTANTRGNHTDSIHFVYAANSLSVEFLAPTPNKLI